jgi:hypothetical protein
MLKTIAAAVCGVVVCGSGTASAQVTIWQDKIFVNLSGGGGGGTSSDVSRQFQFEYFLEPATIQTNRRVDVGGFFDFTAGAQVIDNWMAGISFHRRSGDSDGNYTGSIPDPIETDLPRPVSGTIPDMSHKEAWFALLGGYLLPKFPNMPKFMEKVDLMVFAGPVRVGVEHQVVSNATAVESGSGPVVTIERQVINKSFWGIQVGVDARYMITRNIGAGAFLRYSGASGDITDQVNLDLGGFQGGGGLRLRF